jgi:hypothetical protein
MCGTVRVATRVNDHCYGAGVGFARSVHSRTSPARCSESEPVAAVPADCTCQGVSAREPPGRLPVSRHSRGVFHFVRTSGATFHGCSRCGPRSCARAGACGDVQGVALLIPDWVASGRLDDERHPEELSMLVLSIRALYDCQIAMQRGMDSSRQQERRFPVRPALGSGAQIGATRFWRWARELKRRGRGAEADMAG